MSGYEHRISAASLKTRGLVTITGHGGSWRAAIADRGREFLARPIRPDGW